MIRVAIAAVFVAQVAALPADRAYTRVSIAGLATTRATHVEIAGEVTLVRREPDGDVHIRVSDGHGHAAVCEAIPTLAPPTPWAMPRRGDRVRIWGIARRDRQHGWSEVHPIEGLIIEPRVK